jgi:hypothetical protein
MPTYQLLTDRTLAQSSAITPTTLIHIVYTGDPSQNIAGSSYKAELSQLSNLFSFSGGSGNCITDLYTSNIHSCSPLNINPLDEGNVYFGSTSGVTIDVTNSRVGIGTDSPNYPLQILGGTDTFYYDPFSSVGGVIAISGDSNAPRVSVQTYNSPISNIALGIRSITDTANSIYGKTGDTFLYASQSVNGINIANSNGTGTEDYIRFYAGKSAISTNTPDIHIQGSGSTKGYIGINNSNPQYRLDILDTDNRLYYDPSSEGGTLSLSGNTKLPRYDFIASPYLTKPLVGGSIGVRAWDDVTYGGYGNVGDMHIYAYNSTNGLNIVNQGPGTDTEDYIRFYAGRDASFDPDIHIQGSGSTRGYVGINNSNPTTNLHVSGNTLVSGSLSATTLNLTANNNLNTANNTLRFTDTDTIVANDQFSGKIEFYSSDNTGVGVKSYIAGIVSGDSRGSLIFGTTGITGSLTGGTTVGERMRIDSNGYVGIGQISPSYTLDVSSGVENVDEIALRVANNGNKGVYFAPTANDSSFNQNTISGDTVIVGSPGESLVIGSNTGYAGLRFSGGSGALAMTSTGWLGLGSQYIGDPTEQPSQQLDVEGNARFRAVGATAFFAPLNITSDGTLTTATSDIRLKENIEPLTNSLEKLLQLTGVTYSWIGQEGKRIGFIAQDVEKVIPDLVFINNNTEDKIKGIHLDNITAVLVEAIKEQQKIIEELKVRISNLES